MAAKLDALPDYDANLYHRIGRCFFNTDRYWEARTAFTRVVAIAQDEAVREAVVHFDLILAISRLRRFDDLVLEADRYLAFDPAGRWRGLRRTAARCRGGRILKILNVQYPTSNIQPNKSERKPRLLT